MGKLSAVYFCVRRTYFPWDTFTKVVGSFEGCFPLPHTSHQEWTGSHVWVANEVVPGSVYTLELSVSSLLSLVVVVCNESKKSSGKTSREWHCGGGVKNTVFYGYVYPVTYEHS